MVEEEADESCFWMELIVESGLVKAERVDGLLQEANELVAIISASRKSAARQVGSSPIENRKSKIENRDVQGL